MNKKNTHVKRYAKRQESRVARHRRTRMEQRKRRLLGWARLGWWAIGIALVIVFMAHNDLMNTTGLLAVLGVMDVVSRAWNFIADKVLNKWDDDKDRH